MAEIVPTYTTPMELARKLGASPRFVSDTVRALGLFCKIGQKVIMLDHHVVEFMGAMECRLRSSTEQALQLQGHRCRQAIVRRYGNDGQEDRGKDRRRSRSKSMAKSS